MTPLLEAVDVRKRYGDVVALDGVNLAVGEGALFSEGGFAPLPNLPPGLRRRSPRSNAAKTQV